MYYLGVDLGGTTIKAGLFDEQLQLLKMVQKNTGASLGADIVLKRIEKCLEILVLKNNLLFEQIDALGIGVPGLLNRNDGISLFSPNFNNWHNVKIKEWFEHKWLIPTVIDNDVRMHLYGELYFGAGKGFKNIILIAIGTGLGSGIVVDGHVLYGANDSVGEIGHVNMYRHGRACRCGSSGCLGRYVSAVGMINTFKEKDIDHMSIVNRWVNNCDEITAKMICQAYDLNDSIAVATLKETGEILGYGITNLINLFNPERIIIGGGVSNAGERLLASTREVAAIHALEIASNNCDLVVAELWEQAGMYGAAKYAKRKLIL